MAIFKRKKMGEIAPAFDPTRLPKHIAIILDGNGRWAKKRGLPRTAGHAVGAETVRRIANYCKDIGIDYLTLYAFSTENWKRPQDEVNTLMDIFERYIMEAIDVMKKDGIRMDFFGDLAGLSPELQELLIHGFSDKELREVVSELYVDDAADLVEEMPASVVKRILAQADPEMTEVFFFCLFRGAKDIFIILRDRENIDGSGGGCVWRSGLPRSGTRRSCFRW